jgi:cytochrome c oxidase cbb3-type subunit 2
MRIRNVVVVVALMGAALVARADDESAEPEAIEEGELAEGEDVLEAGTFDEEDEGETDDPFELSRLDDERARARAAGATLYAQYCATCHGRNGDGKGPSARFLQSKPRDFRTGMFKYRTTPYGTAPTVSDIERTIAVGVLGSSMPGFRHVLGKTKRRILARYVLSIPPQFWVPGGRDGATPVEIPKPSRNSKAARKRGKELYKQLCASCHGKSGRGNGPAAKSLRDSAGKRSIATDLTGPGFGGGRGPRVIYRTITTGLSGTPMVGFAAGLTPKQRWELSFFVDSLSSSEGLGGYLFGPIPGR